MAGSSASSPPRRAVLPHCTMRVEHARESRLRGGRNTHGSSFMPGHETGGELCSMTAPSVPPITITKAVICSSEEIWPPSRACPPRMAARPRTMPMGLMRSMTKVS